MTLFTARSAKLSSSSHRSRLGLPHLEVNVRVLVVEDEVKMASLLKRGLEEEGYAVDVSGTGHDALWQVGLGLPPAVVESSRSSEWRN